jgi:predicted nucleic acid-binding protein
MKTVLTVSEVNQDFTKAQRAWIAASALHTGLTVDTCNTSDFAPMNVLFLNPWTIG